MNTSKKDTNISLQIILPNIRLNPHKIPQHPSHKILPKHHHLLLTNPHPTRVAPKVNFRHLLFQSVGEGGEKRTPGEEGGRGGGEVCGAGDEEEVRGAGEGRDGGY